MFKKITPVFIILLLSFIYFNFSKVQAAGPENLFSIDANTAALWRFNDVPGNTIIDETGINNGTAIGTAVVDGKFGKARYFNGQTDYIVVPDNPSLRNFSQLTIEAWVYPSGFDLNCWAVDEAIVEKGFTIDGRLHGYTLHMARNQDGSCAGASSFNAIQFNLGFEDEGRIAVSSSNWHVPNNWYYVVGTYDGNNTRIYVNGVLEGVSDSVSGIVANTTAPLYINHHTWGFGGSGNQQSSQRMQGLIDEIRISKVARSAEEISYYYNLAMGQNIIPSLFDLGQYKSDSITSIAEGGTVTESSIILGATLNSSSTNQLQLQAELRKLSENFTNQPTATSTFVSSGTNVTIPINNLNDGQYHWQARVIDDKGNASDWQEFGTSGNVDFVVQLPLNVKAANLAKLVINAPYLGNGNTWGGKGWDSLRGLYVSSADIFNGYNFWNNATSVKAIQFGAGLDCSGLILWSYNRSFDPNKYFPQNVIRYENASGQYLHNSETINESDLQAGDLLFMDKDYNGKVDHVAMYVGDNGDYDIIEAFSPHEGIISANITEFKKRTGFNTNKHVRRVTVSPSFGGQVQAGSPVDLIVTDPDGFTITPTTAIQTDNEYLREIPGELYYAEGEIGSDGKPKDMVYWPKQKTGDYIIKAIPEEGVDSTATYSLKFTTGNQTINLAENVPINKIPSEGYGVIIEESGTVSQFIPVLIDVKPDSSSNSINLSSNGTVPAAIFGSATLDVAQIDPSTVTLANSPIKFKGNGQPMTSYEDIDNDSFTDIVVHIVTKDLQLSLDDTQANLEGRLISGEIIKGSDFIRIVP